MAVYVAGISILAKNELNTNSKDSILNKIFLIVTIASVIYLIVQNYSWISIIFLGIFSILIFFSLKHYKTNISKIVTIQILGIILLDAVVVSLSNEFLYWDNFIITHYPRIYHHKKAIHHIIIQ